MPAPTATPPRPRRLLGFSTKMYFTPAQTASYLQTLLSTPLPATLDLFLLPDYLSLALLSTAPTAPVALGAQDAHWAPSGAFTGCVAAPALASLGARFVALGHAERRREFGETDAIVARKAAAVAAAGMVPLVCIGELDPGGVDGAVDGVRAQVESVMRAVGDAEVVLAYEPVWAIGAARPAGAAHVVGVVAKVKGMACIAKRGKAVRVVYGGSVSEGLWGRLKEAEGAEEGDVVDGLFCGRFAHDVEAFRRIIAEIDGRGNIRRSQRVV
ncbi:Triosephosphate isomerase [Geopyxis carbonaria]|nr:Triosephosphate isomerase [Geopyxis carbonaria]